MHTPDSGVGFTTDTNCDLLKSSPFSEPHHFPHLRNETSNSPLSAVAMALGLWDI